MTTRTLRPYFAPLIWICALSAPPARGADTTEVILLGTLHGEHKENSRYSLETLRDLIVKLKPAAILVELPPTIGGQASIEKQRVNSAPQRGADHQWREVPPM